MRACAWCGGSLDGKRRHARYCDASCRSAARHHQPEKTVRKRAQLVLAAPPPQLRRFVEDLELARSLSRARKPAVDRPEPVVRSPATSCTRNR